MFVQRILKKIWNKIYRIYHVIVWMRRREKNIGYDVTMKQWQDISCHWGAYMYSTLHSEGCLLLLYPMSMHMINNTCAFRLEHSQTAACCLFQKSTLWVHPKPTNDFFIAIPKKTYEGRRKGGVPGVATVIFSGRSFRSPTATGAHKDSSSPAVPHHTIRRGYKKNFRAV